MDGAFAANFASFDDPGVFDLKIPAWLSAELAAKEFAITAVLLVLLPGSVAALIEAAELPGIK